MDPLPRAGREKITGDSWLMRDLWSTKRGCIEGFITAPRKLKATGVKRLVEDALWTQGVRTRLPTGKKRHEFQANHGFRKWFKTRCELAGMKPINIEILMGHSVGISDSRDLALHLLTSLGDLLDCLRCSLQARKTSQNSQNLESSRLTPFLPQAAQGQILHGRNPWNRRLGTLMPCPSSVPQRTCFPCACL